MFDMHLKAAKLVLATLMSSFLIQPKTVIFYHILKMPWHKGNQLVLLYCCNKVGSSCISNSLGNCSSLPNNNHQNIQSGCSVIGGNAP